MNSKKLAILISIFIVVVLVVVLASTIFTLKTVSFNFLNQRFVLKDNVSEDYLNNVSVPYGDSIFLINKDELTSKLEKKNAYLQVIGVETTFPNNLVIHASEREETFAIKVNNNTYAITDKYLKILRFCDDSYLNRDGYLAPIKVNIEYAEFDVTDNNYQLCDFIKEDHVTDILYNLAIAFEKSGYSITSMKGFVTNIDLRETGSFVSNSEGEYDLTFVKTAEMNTKFGIKLSISNAYTDLQFKLALGLSAYEAEHDKHNTNGEILVFEKQGTIVARYRQD